MTEQQPPESQSFHTQCEHFIRLLHLITWKKEDGPQTGRCITGLSGLGKTISVEVFLSTKSDRKQHDLLNDEKGQS